MVWEPCVMGCPLFIVVIRFSSLKMYQSTYHFAILTGTI
uniref:Uncharacterized protein n=1 Tax=Rhizophora mucronata TaxID=61149 RepID=A0A2P2PX64_RHIMU